MSTIPLPIVNFDAETGDRGSVTQGGEQVIAPRLRLCGGVLSGALAPWYESASSGGGSVAVVGAAAEVHSGVSVAGRGLLRTIDFARVIAPQQNHCTIVLAMPTLLTAGGRYRFGAFTDTDGFFFEVLTGPSPTAVMKTRKAGVDTSHTPPLAGEQFTLNVGRHAYTIRYLITVAHFLQDGRLRHTVRSTAVGPLVQDPDVQVRVEAENLAGGGTDFIAIAANAHISRIGPEAMGALRVYGPYRIATSTTSVQLITEQPMRRLLIIHNESNAFMFLKYGATASSTDYTYLLPPNATIEIKGGEWAGRVDAILRSGAGFAQITVTAEG